MEQGGNMQSKMTIEYLPVKQLHEYSRNAKKHPKEQIEYIANSIREFGFRQPLVIDKDSVLVIGHGRLLAARKLRIDTVPCVRADDLTDEQIKALRLADNKTNESEWDFELLDLELDGIADIDMAEYGFDIDDISPDDFGDEFSLPDGDKPEICTMTFTLHQEQKSLIEYAMSLVEDNVVETFGNTNKNGNALYEVIREWAEQRK
jgi:hypothetical protein